MNRLFQTALALTTIACVACTDAPEIDPATERESLMQADRDFAVDTAARGGDGWADWFAEDGVMFPREGRVRGREAIRERMLPVFTPENPRLIWEPESAVVAASGDLGYTVGHWRMLPVGSDDTAEALRTGSYVSIWRKDSSGKWRVVLDIGNDDPTP